MIRYQIIDDSMYLEFPVKNAGVSRKNIVEYRILALDDSNLIIRSADNIVF